MYKLSEQYTMGRNITLVVDNTGKPPMMFAHMHGTDAVTVKLLARESPSALPSSFMITLEFKG